jgi:hypothetical protein
MPTWTQSPPSDPRGQGLPLVRTPANRPLRAIVTSDHLIGTDTHFWGGHTVPCERPECDACNNGVAFRWHGYLAAYDPQTQLHFVFEMTAQAAQSFADYLKQNDTLRCAEFEAYRWQRRRNGRVILKILHSAWASHALPKAPHLEQVMAIIWRLPAANVQTIGQERGHPKVYADSKGNGDSPDPRDYSLPFP